MDLTTLPWEFIGKIVLAGVLGGAIGVERDLSGRPAGLRTNIIIGVASCLFTILSIEGFPGANSDTSRVAAQIVTGVGFLGAGALIHNKDRVLGLTTAADIWLVAAIGMGVATGMYALSIFVAVFTIICVAGFAPVSHWLEKKGNKRMEKKGLKTVKE